MSPPPIGAHGGRPGRAGPGRAGPDPQDVLRTDPQDGPAPHIWNVLDVRISRASGAVTAALDLDGGLVCGAGLAAPGLVALLADSALGSAAADRAPDEMIATAVLSVDFTARPAETGSLSATAAPGGRRLGDFLQTAGAVYDGAGAEVARAGAWFAVSGARVRPRQRSGLPGWCREPMPPITVPAEQAWADPCATPIGRTLGIADFARTGPGTTRLVLPRVGQLRNSGDTLHGGVGALLAGMAALATLGDMPPTSHDVLSMTCHYLRAGGDGAGPIQVLGSRLRRGRSSAAVRGEVRSGDGRTALVATLSVALGEGRAPGDPEVGTTGPHRDGPPA